MLLDIEKINFLAPWEHIKVSGLFNIYMVYLHMLVAMHTGYFN